MANALPKHVVRTIPGAWSMLTLKGDAGWFTSGGTSPTELEAVEGGGAYWNRNPKVGRMTGNDQYLFLFIQFAGWVGGGMSAAAEGNLTITLSGLVPGSEPAPITVVFAGDDPNIDNNLDETEAEVERRA